MAYHKLMLEFPTTTNDCILRIDDVSSYNPDVQVACPILSVTLPGFNYSVQFGEEDYSLGFGLALTACQLEIQTEGCGTTFASLPDGIYAIKYSVSPNDLVFVEYNHMRITKALNKYQAILCDLDVAACAPDTETEKKLHDLDLIKMQLEASVAMVEICHNPKRGMELYKYAVKQLDKFTCRTCQN